MFVFLLWFSCCLRLCCFVLSVVVYYCGLLVASWFGMFFVVCFVVSLIVVVLCVGVCL